MSNFVAKRNDGRALWRVIYDEVVRRLDAGEVQVGEFIAHEDLRKLLTDQEQPNYYGAVTRASGELAKQKSRCLRPQRGSGYRVTAGMSQVEFGQDHRKRGMRSVKRGLNLVKTSDRTLMSPADRTWTDKVQGGLVALANIAAMHEERLIEIDTSVNDLRAAQMKSKLQQSATAEELAELRRRIEQIEGAKV